MEDGREGKATEAPQLEAPKLRLPFSLVAQAATGERRTQKTGTGVGVQHTCQCAGEVIRDPVENTVGDSKAVGRSAPGHINDWGRPAQNF